MFNRIVVYLMFVMGPLITAGCIMDEGLEEKKTVEESPITLIEELVHTENFRSGALEHILQGEINRKGQAVGYHYDMLPTKEGHIVEDTKTELDEYGVYEAKVMIHDKEKKGNKGVSSFFPDHWDTQDVIDAINDAYDTKVLITGNIYDGLAENGVMIRMYLDKNEKIISAFPLYEGE